MNYQSLRGYGQILKGDKLIIISADGSVKKAVARDVLNKNTRQEEIIINKKKNLYFIVSMVIDGTSWAKCVALAPATATN